MNILNIILAVFIIFAIVSYLYLKTKQMRTNLPIRKKWYQFRAGQSLSIMLVLFAANQLILFQTPITYVISALLILFGVTTMIGYTKRVRHYGQFIQEEFVLNQ